MLRVWGKMAGVGPRHASERARLWAATMEGYEGSADDLTVAHQNSSAVVGSVDGPSALIPITREDRENLLNATMAPGATRSVGAGRRAKEEAPDPYRTCFERDRDRILHSSAFRRLAGKTQVFVFPDDHQRTRLTHALEVAQVASSIARSVGLNVALTEAIALGHDCGHGPGGHASEDALEPFVEGGFNHASWGADVSLRSLNLCEETLDGIRNHSWSRPAPSTPEGEVVSWADRIAYVCHDFEDAVSANVVAPDDLPELVRRRCGTKRGQQLGSLIDAVVTTVLATGQVGMDASHAQALAVFRAFNYETIYLRDASQKNARKVEGMLRALVEYFIAHPEELPTSSNADIHPVHDAVEYVAGMTDRFACRSAVQLLDWPIDELPSGIDR